MPRASSKGVLGTFGAVNSQYLGHQPFFNETVLLNQLGHKQGQRLKAIFGHSLKGSEKLEVLIN